MEQGKEPHAISLKVLRLSRPSLSEQYPFPEAGGDGGDVGSDVKSADARASLSYPSAADRAFIVSPLLSLPTGFGTAFVGSMFTCTICANNELPPDGDRRVTSVQVGAEISTPSTPSTALRLTPEDAHSPDPTNGSAKDDDGQAPPPGPAPGLDHGSTLQKLLSFDLREEGAHTLAVSVTYETTTTTADGAAVTGRRTRSFRKLYQFAAVPCLSVRTKATDLLVPGGGQAAEEDYARHVLEKATADRFALEAQLENLTDAPITLEGVIFDPRPPFAGLSLNWDLAMAGAATAAGSDGPATTSAAHLSAPTLSPGAVHQVCYLIAESQEAAKAPGSRKEITKDGRVVLGTLTIKWRGPMGDPGVLSTGWLTSKRR